MASSADLGGVEVLALDRPHSRVEHVIKGAKGEGLEGPRGHAWLARAEDVQLAGDARGRIVQVHRLHLVTDITVHALVVGEARRLEQISPAQHAVDARRVAVRASACLGRHPVTRVSSTTIKV